MVILLLFKCVQFSIYTNQLSAAQLRVTEEKAWAKNRLKELTL